MLKKKKKKIQKHFYFFKCYSFPSPENIPSLKYSSGERRLALSQIILWHLGPSRVLFLGSHRLESQFDWSGVLSGCIFKLIKIKCLWLTVYLQWGFPIAVAAFLCAIYSALMGLFLCSWQVEKWGVYFCCFLFLLSFVVYVILEETA